MPVNALGDDVAFCMQLCSVSTPALLHQFALVSASIGSCELPHTFRLRGIDSHQPAQRIWASSNQQTWLMNHHLYRR